MQVNNVVAACPKQPVEPRHPSSIQEWAHATSAVAEAVDSHTTGNQVRNDVVLPRKDIGDLVLKIVAVTLPGSGAQQPFSATGPKAFNHVEYAEAWITHGPTP
jgi:hypothetical protein